MKNLEIRVFDGCKKQKAETITYIRNYFGSKNQTRKIIVQIEVSRLMCDIVSSPTFIIFIGTKESPSIFIVIMS